MYGHLSYSVLAQGLGLSHIRVPIYQKGSTMQIADGIYYVGVNDHELDLFEGQYIVPNGMAYNSYAILDDKIAVMDSVDANFGDEWIANLESVLDGRTPDYLIVQHMEPDHSANITTFANKYPEATIVGSVGAFNMMQNYFGIVGKFGVPVQKVLAKAANLDIQTICPLHGPILSENLEHYLGQYQTWSAYDVETPGVVIAYSSVYGHTKEAVELLASELEKKGCPRVVVTDLARDDQAEAVEDAFRHGHLVLATTTYCGGVFPAMEQFIHHLLDHAFQKRTVAFVENGSWMPAATKGMRALMEKCANITFAQNSVTVKGALNDDSRAQIDALATELAAQF